MRRRLLQIGRWLLLGLALAAVSTPAAASARSLVLESFAVEIQVLPTGDLLVTETIQPRFAGSWNGLERTIPVEYRTPQGFSYHLDLTPVGVTDDRGAPLKYESRRDRHYRTFRIWIPGAVDATRTLIFTYRVANGLKFFEDHDELYWNVTGDEWDVPIEAASARILLPAGVTGVRALAFTGAYGAREQAAEVTITGPEVTMRMTRVLGFREGLTAVVGWDKGFVAEPGALALAFRFLKDNWPLGIPPGVLAFMWHRWYKRGRDPRLRPITVAYEPPQNLTPAEVGTLVDNSPDLRDISATLVDLAVRGFLKIKQEERTQLLGLWSSSEYQLRRVKDRTEWTGLQAHERALLEGLFSDETQTQVNLGDLENRFYRHLPKLKDSMFLRLLKQGYYEERPDKVRRRYMIAGGVIGFAGFLGMQGALALGANPLAFVIAAIASAGIVIAFGWVMPARTVRGARVLESILGFEEFLSRVEGPKLERIAKTPELFEKFLPYAMALGVESTWARAFEGLYLQPPTWFEGPGGASFQPRAFAANLNSMTSRAESMMTSSPRSSGGSGFSSGGSGGFSGGGFGGGGGRGF